MSSVNAIISPALNAPLERGTITRRPVGANDVLIEIAWAGVCHSDIHTVSGAWGTPTFPLTVGHEIVGIVTEVGPEVTRHKVGDKVGIGCMVNSCRTCKNCLAGQEQFCYEGNTPTYNSLDRDGTITQGGYSTHIVADADFVLSIPDSLPFDKVAPLLCAGITTYTPLKRWNVGPGTRVAVVGLGGLGHIAVKIAAALGAEGSVISRTLSKKEDGLALGASHYYATNDPATFPALANSFDMILTTVSEAFDADTYLELLDQNGALVTVTASTTPITITEFTLQANTRAVSASKYGGIAQTQEMLNFCAEHGIVPEVEIISADQINDAWARVLRSDVRFRFVIDISTLA